MSDENMKEIYRTYQASQDKYIYFLLSATIAAIGFAVTQTKDLKLSAYLIPLGISIICWGFSFFCGCRNRLYFNAILYANYDLLRVQSGEYPEIGGHLQKIEAASKGIKNAMETNNERLVWHSKWQLNLFLIGAAAYILWHMLEMYLRA